MSVRMRPYRTRPVETNPLPGMADEVLEYEIREALALESMWSSDEFSVYYCTKYWMKYREYPATCPCVLCWERRSK